MLQALLSDAVRCLLVTGSCWTLLHLEILHATHAIHDTFTEKNAFFYFIFSNLQSASQLRHNSKLLKLRGSTVGQFTPQ